MKTYEIKKPEGTFYSDYVIQNGTCLAIFEHADRRTVKPVCNTKLTNEDWRKIDIKETPTHYKITL